MSSVLLLPWELLQVRDSGLGHRYNKMHRFLWNVYTNSNSQNYIPLIGSNKCTRVRLVYRGILVYWKGPTPSDTLHWYFLTSLATFWRPKLYLFPLVFVSVRPPVVFDLFCSFVNKNTRQRSFFFFFFHDECGTKNGSHQVQSKDWMFCYFNF